jgi:hypothetical protein
MMASSILNFMYAHEQQRLQERELNTFFFVFEGYALYSGTEGVDDITNCKKIMRK